jgi:hypothetical protein
MTKPDGTDHTVLTDKSVEVHVDATSKFAYAFIALGAAALAAAAVATLIGAPEVYIIEGAVYTLRQLLILA